MRARMVRGSEMGNGGGMERGGLWGVCICWFGMRIYRNGRFVVFLG